MRFVTLLFAIRDSTATGSSTRQPGITDTGATATVAATAASVNDSEDIRAAAQLPPSFKFLSRTLTSVAGEEQHRSTAEATDVNSELNRYMAELQDIGRALPQTAVQFWLDRQSSYQRLSKVALDLVSSPASQAYVERLFSLCGELTARKRNRARVSIYRRVFLKLNRHVL